MVLRIGVGRRGTGARNGNCVPKTPAVFRFLDSRLTICLCPALPASFATQQPYHSIIHLCAYIIGKQDAFFDPRDPRFSLGTLDDRTRWNTVYLAPREFNLVLLIAILYLL